VDSGAWVDEESLCQPVRSGPQNALDAENWLAANLSASSVILRPAGIYGPGRIPNIDALRAGTPVAVDPSSYLNLIHVDDLVQVIDCIVEASNIPHTIYNVCDGAPVLRSEYYQYLANRINAPAPSFVPKVADRNIGIRTRGQGSKRIDTKRLNRDFSISWKYPNYQVGLGPLLDHVDNPK
jgi:nucleoside-diphosphate-sugar epimerase